MHTGDWFAVPELEAINEGSRARVISCEIITKMGQINPKNTNSVALKLNQLSNMAEVPGIHPYPCPLA